MNTDKKNPKNCFWFYPCSSVFIRGHSCFGLFGGFAIVPDLAVKDLVLSAVPCETTGLGLSRNSHPSTPIRPPHPATKDPWVVGSLFSPAIAAIVLRGCTMCPRGE